MAKHSNIFDTITEFARAKDLYRSPLEGLLTSEMWQLREMHRSPLEGLLTSEMRQLREMHRSPLEGLLTSEMRQLREMHRSPLEGLLTSEMRQLREMHRSPLDGLLTSEMRQLHRMHESLFEDTLSAQMRQLREMHQSPLGNALTSQLTQLGDLITSRYSVGGLAARLAATGIIGGFESALVEAAVAAAELVKHSDADVAGTLADARAQSAVVDAVAEVELLMRQEATAAPEEFQRQAVAALREIFTKTIGRLGKAISRQEVMALIGLLGFIWSVVWTLLNYQLAKESAAGGAQDVAKLRTEIRQGDEAQLEELRKSRETLEKLLEEMEKRKDGGAYYSVDRRTFLMSERSMEAEKLLELRPGQYVLRIRRQYKWLEVECYDYLSGEVRRGWVLKNHLHLMTDY